MFGLYVHIPFCATKCAYCDFYSLKYNKETVEKYVEEMCRRLKNINNVFDTVYFGGGTPSILGADNLIKILGNIHYKDNAEITVEVNPRTFKKEFFNKLYEGGFNRVSVGLQSANETELEKLTRNHKAIDVANAVNLAKQAGFKNISLDLMLGIENQTISSLKNSIDFCLNLDITHLSCYMLKIEKNTPFANMNLNLPSDDEVSNMYLFLCDYLENNGFEHYEISNFAKSCFESKHNLIYWKCENYLGLGPSAHSFVNGKRYYFPNDINYFLDKNEYIYSEDGGDLFDYIMLGLRLNSGIKFDYLNNNGFNLDNKFKKKLELLEKNDLIKLDCNGFALTNKGFLVQNSIICELTEDL